MLTSTAPCGKNCYCLSGLSNKIRCIYGTLKFEANGQEHTEQLTVNLPEDARLGQWISVFSCLTRQKIKPRGAKYGVVKFRLDGSNKPLTMIEHVQDFCFQLSMRGKQITASHFVPNFPDPPPPPRPPSRK